ncbi:hypothetical protein [Tsuneonella troitsensis]|uniref:hypothetical protein n=1 Tax=Tsuneonella troitsensis TaxID=292222 RepID=UPI00070AF7C5|nr:hypothetical protein [Tsuneonella troitsensis]
MRKIEITPVASKRERREFVDLAYRLNASEPNWVPPLKMEAIELVTPGKNPFFAHADVELMLARENGRIVGRISAHIDHLALAQPPEQGMGPGTGNWGLLEAEDEEVAHLLIARAEEWLRAKGMTRVLAPLSLSIWEEPGQLVRGHENPPTIMMGHQPERYVGWIESAGYSRAKSLYTYDLPILEGFPPLIQRIIAAGQKNDRIRIRNVDKSRFDEEARLILGILNDAWSDNWGFVPFTEAEIAYAGKKFKPVVFEDLIMIAEYDGEPVAFMMTLPNLNEAIAPLKGSLFPFGWAKLLLWLRRPTVRTMRVPLMGVKKRLQSSRMASQLAFMMIEQIRLNAITRYGAQRGEIGWILEDNQGMIAIADAIDSHVNRVYVIYDKVL